MNTTFGRRLCFIGEWYQEEAAMVRKFTICFYFVDNAIEVYDQRTKKLFLRRTKMPELTDRDFFVGSKINIFGRQFDITDYGDDATRNALAKFRKKTFLLLKSIVLPHLGTILSALVDSNFQINKAQMVQFTAEQVKAFLGKNKGDVQNSVIMNQLVGGPSIGFELIADNAMEKIKCCYNQTRDCPIQIPEPLRVLFDREDIRAGVFCSQSEENAMADLDFFFNPKNGMQLSCNLNNSTLAVIKPHAIKEGNLGKIISEILNNDFKITALCMHLMERVNCEEFYEVYRGILPEYIPMVAQLASGNCIALEIMSNDPKKDCYDSFRKLCGPMDPEIAKLLRPNTLRAKFGVSKALNAIHCTDLPDDTILELQYLFKTLQG